MIDVSVDERVIVVLGQRARPTTGTVTEVRRVWIEVRPDGHGRTYPFRRDDQTDGSKIGSTARFYTLAQWAERERVHAAIDTLRRHGITIAYDSPWRGREVDLAWLLDSSKSVKTEET